MLEPLSLTIAGGGLSGLATAIGLRQRGIPVHLFEAGGYPRHRVCGEFISGVGDKVLENLGIADALSDADRPVSLGLFDREQPRWFGKLSTPARAISRYRLDDRLQRQLTKAGGRLTTRQRVPAQTPSEGLVWAAGRRPQPGRWIGLKCHVRLELQADLEMHLGDYGYVGLNRVEDGWVNLCGLFQLDRTCRGQAMVLFGTYLSSCGLSRLAERLHGVPWREQSFCSVAGFAVGWQARGSERLRLGDAEVMIAPLTGNGMSMALEAAEIALRPLELWARREMSWPQAVSTIQQAQAKRFRRRVALGTMLHHAVFQPRLRAAALGLGDFGLLPLKLLHSLVRS